ncbi:MAG: hypothetical protein CVV24_05890 [Ignavibacteriae bacterium HGW-Ignavibacteriae-3]|nr:MAG: hypothetical protein CVV24_05890 [Ignavibacteriae bacterium HGW-Ignavibacteriae-3]
MTNARSPKSVPLTLFIIFFIISAILVLSGIFLYNIQKAEIKANIYSNLESISKLKTEQILAWRSYRLNDAREIQGNQSFIHDINTWFRNKNDLATGTRIQKWIETLGLDGNYQSIFLLDLKANIKISWNGKEKLGKNALRTFNEALISKKIFLSDLHRAETYKEIHMDLMIPLLERTGKSEAIVGVMMIRIDPVKFLYPLIQSWPTPSKTAETLLIRREGNTVLFLNELRHKKNTALILRASLQDTLMPAARAALGYSGISEGKDYRGVDVLSDIMPVPGTSWFMVTKVDSDEIYRPLFERSGVILFFVLFLIVLTAVSVYLVWKNQQTKYYKAQFKLELEKKVMEQHYSYLIKNANDIIFLMDENGNLLEANDRAVSAYGYNRDELLKLNLYDIRPQAAGKLITRDMKEIAGRGGLIFETVHRKKDGSLFPVEVSARTIEIDNEIFYQSIIRDITDRKDAELKLEHLNRMYSLLSQINQEIVRTKDRKKLFDGICSIAVKFGKFDLSWFGLIDNNKIQIESFSSGKADISTNNVINVSENHRGQNIYKNAIEAGTISVFNNILEEKNFTDPFLKENISDLNSMAIVPVFSGNKVFGLFTVYSSTLNYFDPAQIRLLVEVGSDISYALEKIKSEKTLIESEYWLKKSQTIANIGSYIFDLKTGNWSSSESLDEIFGIDKNYNKNARGWLQLLHPNERDMLLQYLKDKIYNRQNFDKSYRIVRKSDNCDRWVQGLGEFEYNENGEAIVMYGTIQDITEKENAKIELTDAKERAENSEKIKTEFLAQMSHEIRTPVNIILNFINFLKEEFEAKLNPEVYLSFSNIESASKRIIRTIDLILNMSEIQTKSVQIFPRLFDIDKSVLSILYKENKIFADNKKLSFVYNVETDNTQINADDYCVMQIFANLLDNAFKYTEKGKVEINVRRNAEDKLVVAITDTGIGIKKEFIPDLFSAFLQEDKGYSRKYEGNGLGLALVKSYCELNNAAIEVESTKGFGSTFRVIFN